MIEQSRKRQRERPTVDSSRVAIFEDLAHESEDVRLKATIRLLDRLNHRQTKQSDEDAKNDELKYSLTRLYRGLCSSRKAARLGFSLALTEVLSQHCRSDVADALKSWLDITETSGREQMSSQEARDHLMGRVFGAASIIQSGILFGTTDAAATGDSKPSEHWNELLQRLLQLAAKKPWLREQSGWVCLLALQKVKLAGLHGSWASSVLAQWVANGLAKTPEFVALHLKSKDLFDRVALPEGVFEDGDPLSQKNWKLLLRILKESSKESDEEARPIQRSTWSAKPHFAWTIIFQCLPQTVFKSFWLQIVDEGLFSASSSPERKHWGFSLFNQQIVELPGPVTPDLFTRNLCRCLANQTASKDRYLHSAANQSIEAIIGKCRQDAETATKILLGVMAPDGLRSEFLSGPLRSKLTEKLVALTDVDGLDAVQTIIWSSTGGRTTKASAQMSEIDLLLTGVRSRRYPTPTTTDLRIVRETYAELLKRLVKGAYFESEQDVKANDESAAQAPKKKQNSDQLESRLWTCLTSLSTKDSSPFYYPLVTIRSVEELERENNAKLIEDSGAKETVEKARKAIRHAGGLQPAGEKLEDALKTLICLSLLQLYSGESDALEATEDLLPCCDDIKGRAEDRVRASEAMTEIVLSFISKTPKLLNNVCQQAFNLYVDHVSEGSIASLIDVLDTKENVAGRNEMFEDHRGDDEEASEDDDEDGEGSDEEEETSELDSDVEMVDGDAENDSDSSSADSGSGEDEEEDAEVNDFDAKLAQALGTRRADIDLAHEGDESSESDMDDEQMEALDEHLSQVFQQRRQVESKQSQMKKDKRDAKETIVIFKTRVLDLLSTYIHKQSQSALALNLLLPLLRLVQSTQNKALAGKASGLVRDFFKRVKLTNKADGNGTSKIGASSSSSSSSSESKMLLKKSKQLLAEVHELALQAGSNQFHASCSQASLLLAKVHISSGGELDSVTKRYDKTRAAAQGGKELKESFFKDWTHWCASTKQALAK